MGGFSRVGNPKRGIISNYSVFIMLSLVLVSLFSSLVLADSKVESKALVNSILPGEQASFELSIINNALESQSYTVISYASGKGWNLDPSPLSDKVIEDISPNEKYVTKIIVNPLEDFEPGIYYVSVQIESDLGESYNVPLKIYVGTDTPVEYMPSVSLDVSLDELINPGDSQNLVIHLENRNPLNLTDLTLEIQSDLEGLNTVMGAGLESLGSKTLSFTAETEEFQQPKDYYLFLLLKRGEETIKIVEGGFTVSSLTPQFGSNVVSDVVFLKKFQTIILQNSGNVENTQEYFYPVSNFNALFLKSDVDIVSIDGQKNLKFEETLSPGESVYFVVEYNYRVLFYIALFFVLFILFYYVVRSPLSLHKGAVTTTGKEGALHEIKIALEIKNKTKKEIKNVKVIDVIPGIANLEKHLDLGTLKHSKVISTKKGTKIEWHISEIEPLEHRIITYKIKTKLNVIGDFKLPRAIAEFSKKKGKLRKSYSNSFRLDAGKVKE